MLHQLGKEDPGGFVEHDEGRLCGVDVRLPEMEDVTIRSITEYFTSRFKNLPNYEYAFLAVHFKNGNRHEELLFTIRLDGTVELDLDLEGGNPSRLRDTRLKIEVEKLFGAANASVLEADHFFADEGIDHDFWSIRMSLNSQSVTIGELCEALRNTRSALCKVRTEAYSDCSADFMDSLTRGRFEDLVGTEESSWLECKSELNIGNADGNDKLVKAVCGFANGDESGLLVIGLKTDRINSRDVVSSVSPVSARAHTEDRYRKIISEQVSPVVVGLKVGIIAVEDGVLVAVSIPAQERNSKPFMVTKQGGISIFLRNGDFTSRMKPDEIRMLMARGWPE
ncbi:Putative DNA-binding domain-containing protein [Amycolatopsis rubida]|uniref:Putative DNA-binding domain-containing protein n=2 Tax=Amycolatopsis rubida TaxID=112413 RepID=A0A1I5KV24_9PSEU|nr:Putative DNA-binding domain-containing protein [Amycolatopsis rubida]